MNQVDVENGTIEFTLRTPIDIYVDKQTRKVDTIVFKQPNRRTAPIFENLVNMLSTAQQSLAPMMSQMGEETAEAVNDLKEKKEAKKAEDELKDITFESVMKMVEEYKDFLGLATFDYEKAYKKFQKMIVQDARFAVCYIGAAPLMDSHLDSMHFRDLKDMLLIYISFFGESVKSATDSDSKQQSGSPMGAKEL